MNEMKVLVNKLNEANRAYYGEARSLMSDKEYDALYDQLLTLEQKTGIVLANSPTQHVGYEVVSVLPKVEHKEPMLSLDKTKDREELKNWLGTQPGVLSYKMDGLTTVATYRQGKLVQLVTRGTGRIGEDISHNIPAIKGLPARVPYMEELIVRGETIISFEDFNRINDLIENPDDKYKNPRNMASGSLRLLDSKEAAMRGLHFRAFRTYGVSKGQLLDSLRNLREMGFDVVEHVPVNSDNLFDMMDKLTEAVPELPYAVDGLVLAYNDLVYAESLESTSKFPKHSMAFKWADETVTTRMKEIEWSASRSGLINPVAIFEPVHLEGTTVSRASIHNLSIMEKLNLGYGDEITVYKANMIIPQIHENLTNNGDLIPIPSKCPVCGSKAERRMGKDGSESLYCTNLDCAAKHVGKFERMVERDALNVVGVSTHAINLFSQHGYLKELADLYHLEQYQEQIVAMEGFGKRSYDKMISALKNSRKTTFCQFFYALGIPGAGHDAGKILKRSLKLNQAQCLSMELLELTRSENGYDRLVAMEGIGDITAKSILNWMQRHETEYLHLLKELEITDDIPAQVKTDLPLTGLVFVITGSLNGYTNRDQLKAEIEAKGGKVSGSVSKKTSYLINNDVTSTSGKNKKAKELGIPIISEEEYKKQF